MGSRAPIRIGSAARSRMRQKGRGRYWRSHRPLRRISGRTDSDHGSRANPEARALVEKMVEGVPLDKRFVYYVLAATGICVVPISSFCSDLHGFRVTLLEENPEKMAWMYKKLRAAIEEYLAS